MRKNNDFFIAPSEHAPGVIHVMVGAPGLTAAPAISELVTDLLFDSGMNVKEKNNLKKIVLSGLAFRLCLSLNEKT